MKFTTFYFCFIYTYKILFALLEENNNERFLEMNKKKTRISDDKKNWTDSTVHCKENQRVYGSQKLRKKKNAQRKKRNYIIDRVARATHYLQQNVLNARIWQNSHGVFTYPSAFLLIPFLSIKWWALRDVNMWICRHFLVAPKIWD